MGKVEEADAAGERIDYLTFVPDGEPTLDLNLGIEIEMLRSLGIKIAVITNAALIWREDVRAALMPADWVSLKVDAARNAIWRQIDRPHGALELTSIFDGASAFARAFSGELVTETMLVEGVNDGTRDLTEVAGLVAQLKPATAYLAVPTRPPAESWVRPPEEKVINQAYQIFVEKIDEVELLLGYEGDAFACTGNVQQDLLSITSVHPMRKEAVDTFLNEAGASWSTIHELLSAGQLIEVMYQGRIFFMRNLQGVQA